MHLIWHGRPICSAVGDAIVLHPNHPVSLKIAAKIQIRVPLSPLTPPLPPLVPPYLQVGGEGQLRAVYATDIQKILIYLVCCTMIMSLLVVLPPLMTICQSMTFLTLKKALHHCRSLCPLSKQQ